ncbi:hypothetical protein M1N04_00855 [Peptococcaceae bacterium]|nr:hypothetical protein [Peptococcaceae bacterium]
MQNIPDGLDGLLVKYFTDPNKPAFSIAIFLESNTLKQDIAKAREILSQRFSDTQVDQIMNRLEHALIMSKYTRGLKMEAYVFNNIRVTTGNMGNMGVFITVSREGQLY